MRIITPILTNKSTLEALRYDEQKTLLDIIKEDIGVDATREQIIAYFTKNYMLVETEGTYSTIATRYNVPDATVDLLKGMLTDEVSGSIILKYGRYISAYQEGQHAEEAEDNPCECYHQISVAS